MLKTIQLAESPKIPIGEQCDCPLKCYKKLPENNIFDLYRGGKKSDRLYKQGIIKIVDIPDDVELTPRQQIQKANTLHIEKDKIREFLAALQEPLYFMDFETFSLPIPLYDGTRPYQRIPFQFSVLTQGEHFSFIAENMDDPRPEFLRQLRASLGDKGSIITYNESFERGCLNEMADAFPENREWVDLAIGRLADLLIPFREFIYYDPRQQGSCSIKHVLPALTGKSYEGMEISNGETAGNAFLNGGDVRKQLEEYCGLDTEGMILILDVLKKAVL
jgi:hypothetical protein